MLFAAIKRGFEIFFIFTFLDTQAIFAGQIGEGGVQTTCVFF